MHGVILWRRYLNLSVVQLLTWTNAWKQLADRPKIDVCMWIIVRHRALLVNVRNPKDQANSKVLHCRWDSTLPIFGEHRDQSAGAPLFHLTLTWSELALISFSGLTELMTRKKRYQKCLWMQTTRQSHIRVKWANKAPWPWIKILRAWTYSLLCK